VRRRRWRIDTLAVAIAQSDTDSNTITAGYVDEPVPRIELHGE
jgi:hypothetical protein